MILHTMLRVGDMARSVDFYTRVLGMNLLRTTNREEQKIEAEIRIVGIITMHIQLYVDPLDNRFILVNCIHLNGDECSFFDIFCILRNQLTNQTVEIVFIDELD